MPIKRSPKGALIYNPLLYSLPTYLFYFSLFVVAVVLIVVVVAIKHISLTGTWMRLPEWEVTLAGTLFELRSTQLAERSKLSFGEEHRRAGQDPSEHIRGPCLDPNASFSTPSVPAGQYLANEVGSLHQSYTGPEGAVIMILWSGCHAKLTVEDCQGCLETRLRPDV